MNDAGTGVPDWQLERFRLGELPPEERTAVARALERDGALRERLARLDEDDRATLAALPSREAAAAIRRRAALGSPADSTVAGRGRPRWQPAFVLVAAVAAGSIVILLVRPGAVRGPAPPGLEETRIKGLVPELELFRKTAAGAESLSAASVARAGDVVQVAYRAAGGRYGVIVSVDGRGVVTPHLPREGARAVALEPGARVSLPAAYQLDDAPRFEAFYFVTYARPFAVETIRAAALEAVRRGLANDEAAVSVSALRLDLPRGFDQTAFLLKKDTPR